MARMAVVNHSSHTIPVGLVFKAPLVSSRHPLVRTPHLKDQPLKVQGNLTQSQFVSLTAANHGQHLAQRPDVQGCLIMSIAHPQIGQLQWPASLVAIRLPWLQTSEVVPTFQTNKFMPDHSRTRPNKPMTNQGNSSCEPLPYLRLRPNSALPALPTSRIFVVLIHKSRCLTHRT